MLSLLDGVVSRPIRYDPAPGEPPVMVIQARYPRSANRSGKKIRWEAGSGTGLSASEALVPALVEALERRAASSVDRDRLKIATAAELGEYALPLESLPKCSDREMRSRRCGLSKPVMDQPMRWIEGTSLLTGRNIAIPHSLVYLRTDPLAPHERLQVPISTGLAAHNNLARAISCALLEVIERDALSIMWLQRIPGVRVDPFAREDWELEWLKQRSARLEYHFWEISTDLPVSVVCCLRRSPDHETAHSLMTCAASLDIGAALTKAARDISARAIGFRSERSLPANLEDFTRLHHGATYMAAKIRSKAFDFMFGSKGDSHDTKVDWPQLKQNTPEEELGYLMGALRERGLDAYAVDLTTPEAATVGVSVVRVLVPGLQPLPYVYAARYLGHPRLYQVPRLLGLKVYGEHEVNTWPLPFA